MKNTPKNIAIEKLFPFEGHPLRVYHIFDRVTGGI